MVVPIIIIVVLLVIAVGILFFILSVLRKVDQGHALIINKFRGEPKVTFTGGIVIPIAHRAEIMDISVKTIEVDRHGQNGLICADNIRADIKVTFFVKVNKDAKDVIRVASSVGVKRASDQRTLEELFQAKFSEALKTVGKRMNFVDLYNERQKFKEAITEVIGHDLDGYTLVDSAIDYLEQTPLESLDPDNILDAQGRKKIIDLTTDQKVMANEIQRDGEKSIKKQDVEAREAILALQRQEEEAVARQTREIEIVKAREAAEIEKVQAEERYRSEQANIQTAQELGVAQENSNREIQVAEKNRERVIAVETERVEKERHLEVINRERAVELSRIEKDKALEVEKKNIADVVRERVAVEKNVAQEEERIKDLRATMEADRVKQVAVTKAQEEAEAAKLREVLAAEASEAAAAHMAKEKLVLAEADQAAAEKHALAEIRRAEGVQATEAAAGLAAARVEEADALAFEKKGLAQARVKEADATASEKKGMAEVRVKEADAHVIAEQGKAEAEAIREKMNAEAQGLAEKAESMKLLNEGTKDHEEFRLKLEKEVEIAKTEIGAQVDIAERNASILAMALKEANIDIVGGDGQFFDRFIKAVTFGKSLDAAHGKSELLQTAAKDYLSGERSVGEDVTDILSSGKYGPGEIKDLMGAWLMKKIGSGDPAEVQALLKKANELGFGDLSSWLTGDK